MMALNLGILPFRPLYTRFRTVVQKMGTLLLVLSAGVAASDTLFAHAHAAGSAQGTAAGTARSVPFVERALQKGPQVLLVELFDTTLYVFNDAHEVAGPVLNVLRSLGFEPVLPEGVMVPQSGSLPLSLDKLRNTETQHVFFMNFSRDEAFVVRTGRELATIAEGAFYRMDGTVSEAFSTRWKEENLLPRVSDAIKQGTQ
ncbi:hypothetical protein [Sodalis sp. C49]|uniref:hypothetical protein n=1 Tax=Sodalis sp. C49 TaxID=3228929 RepID=UPI003965AD91